MRKGIFSETAKLLIEITQNIRKYLKIFDFLFALTPPPFNVQFIEMLSTFWNQEAREWESPLQSLRKFWAGLGDAIRGTH